MAPTEYTCLECIRSATEVVKLLASQEGDPDWEDLAEAARCFLADQYRRHAQDNDSDEEQDDD